jgi:site-specific DNA-methyltransferase (adenine-specific)
MIDLRMGDSFEVLQTLADNSIDANAGLEGMAEKLGLQVPLKTMSDPRMDREQQRLPNANHHPTVKPLKLMEYLITLITPPNGVVLDPFMGSGSTGVAARKLGFGFIGIEQNEVEACLMA